MQLKSQPKLISEQVRCGEMGPMDPLVSNEILINSRITWGSDVLQKAISASIWKTGGKQDTAISLNAMFKSFYSKQG